MKLSEWRNEYLITSAEVSKLTRQLAFAGIAVVWVFKTPGNGVVNVPSQLILPLIFLCGTLLLDFLHNLVRAEIWRRFYRREERKLVDLRDDPDVVTKVSLTRPIGILYYSKITALVFSYVLLIKYLITIFT